LAENPATTVKINVTGSEPDAGIPSVSFRGRYYWVNDSPWDRTSFFLLNVLFQSTVGKVQNVALPVTIAK
jgi:hypothetical protein